MDAIAGLRLAEQGSLSDRDRSDLLGGEPEPFGPVAAKLAWRPKDRHIVLRAADGRAVAAAGALVASVRVAAAPPFEVVGVGSVIVTKALRGGGLVSNVLEPLLELAATLGPGCALLFCRPALVPLYRRFGFRVIAAAVWADQPEGRIAMPTAAMWRPLRSGCDWPAGRVEVDGLPF